MRYAAQTTVSVATSRSEIEDIVTRYGADQFGHATDNADNRALVQFRIAGKLIRFELPLPSRIDKEFTHSGKKARTESQCTKRWEQACRQRWRALALSIKAKLEAVECKITSFEDEFLSHIVMPNGETFGRWAVPQIQKAIESGQMPKTLMLTHGEGNR